VGVAVKEAVGLGVAVGVLVTVVVGVRELVGVTVGGAGRQGSAMLPSAENDAGTSV